MTSSLVLSEVLQRLGLIDYLDVLVDNGFHTWETVLDITEDDFIALNFKLGHRRSLQREIATYRGIHPRESLDPESIPDEASSLSASALECFSGLPSTPPAVRKEKRRYRRHPRPDSNAPKKPKTACTPAINDNLVLL